MKVSEKVEVTDNVTKEILHTEESSFVEKIEKVKEMGKEKGLIKFADSIKISKNFKSVGVEIGVELPWLIDPANPVSDLDAGMKIAEEYIDKRIATKFKEMEALMAALSAKG